jgi:aldehyde dehydrogenase (NAD+)
VQEDVLPSFKELLIKKIETFYGASAIERKNSPDFARIITTRHAERLQSLISNAVKENAILSFGGDIDTESRYVAPTILEKVDPHSQIMQEEIFGPILPIVPFQKFAEVIHYINERPKPLALYLYSHSTLNKKAISQETSSGGLCINDSIIHLGNTNLPFGGIGDSGHGNYHGYFGFKTFSHEKAALHQSRFGRILRLTHPPYTTLKKNLINRLIRWRL